MPRYVRASNPRPRTTAPPAQPVTVRPLNTPRDGWTEDDAVQMYAEGYNPSLIHERTGYDPAYLEQQVRRGAPGARRARRPTS